MLDKERQMTIASSETALCTKVVDIWRFLRSITISFAFSHSPGGFKGESRLIRCEISMWGKECRQDANGKLEMDDLIFLEFLIIGLFRFCMEFVY